MQDAYFSKKSKQLKVVWISLNLLSITIFLYAGIMLPHTVSGSFISLFCVLLFVLSNVLKYYYYKKGSNSGPDARKVVRELPVINKKMRIIWIALNLLGLGIIIYGILIVGPDMHYLYIMAIGVAVFVLSNVFKYYTYKNGKGHNPQIVR